MMIRKLTFVMAIWVAILWIAAAASAQSPTRLQIRCAAPFDNLYSSWALTSTGATAVTLCPTASTTPTISKTGTWNANVSEVFEKLNITNTLSGAGALITDWQVDSVSKFKVDKSGNLTITGGCTGCTPGTGSLTTNLIPKWSGTAFANSRLTDTGSGDITSSTGLSATGNLTASLQHFGANGVVGTPSFSFTNSPTTGLYRAAADQIGISAAGSNVGTWSSTGLSGTNFTASGLIQAANGAVGAPSVTFTNSLTTGLYRAAADQIGIAIAGANVATWSSTGLATTQSVTAPTVTSTGALALTTAANGNITLTPNGTGIVSMGHALVSPPVSITDNGSTLATNAALGNTFRSTAITANITLSNPTNPTDGQRIVWEIIQNAGAAKTLAFDTQFKFGAEITACTISATLSSHDFITAQYNSTTTKWYVTGCVTGY